MSSEQPIVRLAEVARINPSRPTRKGSFVPFVEMAALPAWTRDIETSDIKYRPAKGAGAHFRNGDTLLARITPCLENGKTAQVRCLKEGDVGEGSTEFIVLCGIDEADNDFIYYLCRTPDFREFAIAQMHGTSGRQRVAWKSLTDFQFNCPPASTRRTLANLLTSLDDRIALLRQTNSTLESIIQSLFKSWFIDFDPVHTIRAGGAPKGMDAGTAALFPSELDESSSWLLPKKWHFGTLGEICSRSGGFIKTGPFGSQLHASDYVDEGIPVVMPQDLRARRISTTRIARVRVEDVDRLARHKLAVGDIVFSRRGDVGLHATVTSLEVGWLCGTGCLLVRMGPSWPSPSYLSQALARPETAEWLHRHAVGATMPNLNTSILGAVPMLVPSDAVLRAFEDTASVLDAQVTANLAQCDTLAKIRDTLLPRLISGKLRLPEAQAQVEDAIA